MAAEKGAKTIKVRSARLSRELWAARRDNLAAVRSRILSHKPRKCPAPIAALHERMITGLPPRSDLERLRRSPVATNIACGP
jgi:hypothetical protein